MRERVSERGSEGVSEGERERARYLHIRSVLKQNMPRSASIPFPAGVVLYTSPSSSPHAAQVITLAELPASRALAADDSRTKVLASTATDDAARSAATCRECAQ